MRTANPTVLGRLKRKCYCLTKICLLGLLPLMALAQAQNSSAPETQTLQWADLLPEPEKAALEAAREVLIEIPPMPDLGALSPSEQASWLNKVPIGSSQAVTKHDNQQVALIGYPAPLNANSDMQSISNNFDGLSFLLVPEFGAGIYQPLPPPNQTVRINLPAELAKAQGKTLPPPESPIKIVGQLKRATQPGAPYAYAIDATQWDW